MKLALRIKENIYNFMRQCGYYFEGPAASDAARANKEELVFSRPIGSSKSGYPRFHAYVSRETPPTISLHLDQKKPIYKGAPAHSAEYEGKTVEKEAERIKKILQK